MSRKIVGKSLTQKIVISTQLMNVVREMIGRVTPVNACQRLAPSIFAAS